MKYYEAIRNLADLIQVGDKFVCWDGRRLYPANATLTSAYLDKRKLDVRGFDNYFKECEPFAAPFLTGIVKRERAEIQQMESQICELRRQIGQRRMSIKQIDDNKVERSDEQVFYDAARMMFDDMVKLKLPVPEEAARIFGKENGR